MQKIYEVLFLDGRWKLILHGLYTTIIIAICAIIIGTILGIILALFKISKNKPLRIIATFYIIVIRGIPLATQLMLFAFVILPSLQVNKVIIAIIAFGLNSAAYVAEIIRAGIQGIDIGQMEAGRSLGLNKTQTMVSIIFPQAIKAVLPTYTNEFVVLIKETSVVGFIAVTDLTRASDMIRNATYNAWIPLIFAALIYLALTLSLSTLFTKLERRLARSDRN